MEVTIPEMQAMLEDLAASATSPAVAQRLRTTASQVRPGTTHTRAGITWVAA